MCPSYCCCKRRSCGYCSGLKSKACLHLQNYILTSISCLVFVRTRSSNVAEKTAHNMYYLKETREVNSTQCLKKRHWWYHYRFNPHQPISVIFGRDVAERVCYWMMIYYSTSPNVIGLMVILIILIIIIIIILKF